MLYITTRDNRDAYTAYKTLHTDYAVDGGAYLPFRMPIFQNSDLNDFVQAGFSQTVATILNRFFSCGVTSWDVDLCFGKNAVKLVHMPHRLAVAELWRNPENSFEGITKELYSKVAGINTGILTEWFFVAVRIAVMFGIYTQMRKNDLVAEGETFSVSVPADNFDIPISAHYAKEMGLPIDTIICTSDESTGIWDFIHLGELNTALIGDRAIGFERFLHSKLNFEGVTKFIDAVNKKRIYRVPEESLGNFNQGMFCATAGKNRSSQIINSVFRTNNYIIDPVAALCIGGLQDYRAKVGEGKLAIVFSEASPLLKANFIAEATGISVNKLPDYIA